MPLVNVEVPKNNAAVVLTQVSADPDATDCPIGSGFIISLCASNLTARVVGAVIVIESKKE